MSASFKPLSFEAWRDEQIASRPPDMPVDCPECDGEGDVECSCCGHERECDLCDGRGRVEWSELDEGQKRRLVHRGAYAKAVLEDAFAWAGWLGRDAVSELFHAGFRVYSRLPDRVLCVATRSQEGSA
ncbi:MAG: hypothetical protein GX856_07055 [Gammaproteobacteria bacterium]|nr:hypothetical protein [Gammaproteobacteria bacterium]